jgi:O-antigen/teichoic acid export membrane protein
MASATPGSGLPGKWTGDDLTGRDRMFGNVAASWAGQIVFIVAGFIMPRQIDHHLGQAGLGVWDFGWTVVNYFYLTQIGVGMSVNRYVAKHRAVGDVQGLTRTISAAFCLQMAAACGALLLTAVSAMVLPALFHVRLGEDVAVARMVIAFLGASIAVRMVFQVFNGVVTGCHRWDLHNLLNAGMYAVIVTGMLVVLAFGGGLGAISAVYLAGTVLNELARTVLAYRVCPELRISIGSVRWEDARGLLSFGAKLSSIDAVKILAAQLTSLIVVSQLGLATLAVYSRLSGLIRQTQTIAYKFSLPLTPMASSLQGSGKDDEIRELFIDSARSASYLVWPILIMLALVGDAIMLLWMGPRYDQPLVLAVMALGMLLPISQQPMEMILIGLNLHGRFAAFSIGGAIVSFAASVIALHWLHWNLLGLVGIGLVVANVDACWVAVNTCRRLRIPVRTYFVNAYAGPIACCVPFAVAVALLRLVPFERPHMRLLCACGLACVILGPVYWRRVITAERRASLIRIATSPWAAQPVSAEPKSLP